MFEYVEENSKIGSNVFYITYDTVSIFLSLTVHGDYRDIVYLYDMKLLSACLWEVRCLRMFFVKLMECC